jgi:general secretion pathway protein D
MASVRSFFFCLCVVAAAYSGSASHASAQGAPAPNAPKKKRTPASGTNTQTLTPPAPGVPAPAVEGAEGIKQFESGIDYKPTSPSARVTFNLEDADLPELVRLMSQITGRSFILPSKSRSIKATVYAPTKVTAAEAYQAFLSILELNGMAIVPSGRYLKIVESGRVEGRAVPLFSGDEQVPDGDRYVTRLQVVKNIAAEDASKLLERFKSGDGGITAYAPTNTLVITDTGTNLKRMLRILGEVDVAHTGEHMWVEPIHHANASDLEKRLSDIFDVQGGGSGGGSANKTPPKAAAKPSTNGTGTVGSGELRLTKVIADERTNSLVIVATESAYLRVLEVLKYLDTSMEGEGHMHVHHLQHSDAEEVANTLSNLIGKGGGGSGAGAGQKAAGGGNASADSVFEGKVAITAHKASNALVITSSMHDFAALKNVIGLIDTERRQVFIEAVIMELGVKRSSKLGLGYHGGVPDAPTNDALAVLGFNSKQTVGGLAGYATQGLAGDLLTGLAVGVFGPQLTNATAFGFSLPAFGVALQAFAADGDANVLSTPHLIASDNVEAEIKVGENVPLQTSSPGGGLGGLGALAGLGALGGAQAGGLGALGRGGLGGLGGIGTVPRQDVGTTVTITPHLNDSGEIRLTIAEEISAAGAPDQSGNLGVRSISRTNAKTEVVVRDQQTVVIGGLMRDEISTSRTKIPILGDIPVLGTLFRTNEKNKVKKNLLLFLTPYILRSPSDLRAIYERKMRERQEFIDRYFVFSDSDYEVPVDYSRTRGLLGEIFAELLQQDNERKLALEAQKRPETGHFASDPIGNGVSRGNGGDAGNTPGQAPPGAEAGQENAPGAPEAPPTAANFAPPNTPPPPEAVEQLAPPPVIAPEESQ